MSDLKELSHLDPEGSARMVDVGEKPVTRRIAAASALVRMAPGTREAVLEGNLPKGDVFNTARIAGILAAKRVHELIPLTHPLSLDYVQVSFRPEPEGVRVWTEVSVEARTGVEMEALTAAAVAALTIYDMAKSVEKGMVISDIRLEHKSGGRSGVWSRRKES
ncbi:MAG: cyclic pyranopterin monophosphate synthase MoaC [bacterium]